MRLVYAHFPINVNVTNEETRLEIRNFLGEKLIRKIDMLEGVKVIRSNAVKDQIEIAGNDIEKVSLSGDFPSHSFFSHEFYPLSPPLISFSLIVSCSCSSIVLSQKQGYQKILGWNLRQRKDKHCSTATMIFSPFFFDIKQRDVNDPNYS